MRSAAQEYELPAALTAWFARLDDDGRAALSRLAWYQHVVDELHEWQRRPTIEDDPSAQRNEKPMHFVVGRMSPFYIERFITPDQQRSMFAVYYGPYTTNGSVELGPGQGGAQAALVMLTTLEPEAVMNLAQADLSMCVMPAVRLPLRNDCGGSTAEATKAGCNSISPCPYACASRTDPWRISRRGVVAFHRGTQNNGEGTAHTWQSWRSLARIGGSAYVILRETPSSEGTNAIGSKTSRTQQSKL